MSDLEKLLKELREEGSCTEEEIKEIVQEFPDGLGSGWEYRGGGEFVNENESDEDYRHWYVCGCCWCCGHRTDCHFDYFYQKGEAEKREAEWLQNKLNKIWQEVSR